jgi:DnaJ-class molecular chaperone
MNTRAALDTLKVPRFGDANQIAAVHYLEDVESARVAFGKCRHSKCATCKGSGAHRRWSDMPCDYCGGSGTGADCKCFYGLDSDAVLEAKRK